MPATINDVARRCGYSKATVSRAYSNPLSVSDKAREKIYAAAKELNYTPNAIARAMARQRTENVAFIIHEKQYPANMNPFYAPILDALVRETSKRNYSVFVTTNHDSRLPNGEICITKKMDGVIFAGEADPEVVESFLNQKIPVVLLNNEMHMDQLTCIVVDHYQGAVAAVEHLYEKGYRNIGIISGRFSTQVYEARLKGYVDVMMRHGLSLDETFMATIEPTVEEAIATMTAMLQKNNHPSAFFCTNDTIAAGAVKAALRMGLKVPEDVAVVGFDDSVVSRMVEPELTTVHIDSAKMGQIAATRLFEYIEQECKPTEIITIPTSLVVRDTT